MPAAAFTIIHILQSPFPFQSRAQQPPAATSAQVMLCSFASSPHSISVAAAAQEEEECTKYFVYKAAEWEAAHRTLGPGHWTTKFV